MIRWFSLQRTTTIFLFRKWISFVTIYNIIFATDILTAFSMKRNLTNGSNQLRSSSMTRKRRIWNFFRDQKYRKRDSINLNQCNRSILITNYFNIIRTWNVMSDHDELIINRLIHPEVHEIHFWNYNRYQGSCDVVIHEISIFIMNFNILISTIET